MSIGDVVRKMQSARRRSEKRRLAAMTLQGTPYYYLSGDKVRVIAAEVGVSEVVSEEIETSSGISVGVSTTNTAMSRSSNKQTRAERHWPVQLSRKVTQALVEADFVDPFPSFYKGVYTLGTGYAKAGILRAMDMTPSRAALMGITSADETTTVVACGSVHHYRGGAEPIDLPTHTWYPSRVFEFAQTIQMMASDSVGDAPNPTEVVRSVDGSLAENFLNVGFDLVGQGPAVFEGWVDFLLQIYTTETVSGHRVIVGSPVWVARAQRPLPPGLYYHPVERPALREFDGQRWGDRCVRNGIVEDVPLPEELQTNDPIAEIFRESIIIGMRETDRHRGPIMQREPGWWPDPQYRG